jgi:RNA polymerase sigma-70 factor (ECF subfamily)
MTRNYSEAKELLSETLYQAFSAYKDLKSDVAFLSFAFTIASRVYYKSLNKKVVFEDDFDLDLITNDNLSPETRLDITFLKENINRLSDDYKETLILFEIEGFSRKEISKILGVAEDTVKSRLYRARKKLGELMGVGDETRIG